MYGENATQEQIVEMGLTKGDVSLYYPPNALPDISSVSVGNV